ncbi:uncharacterized protein LOC111390697 [Olea europaea var. sylvestris]|uniref:Heat shock, cysteine-rich domain containing n=1 Tax=Olea europaea subsp. europaea TaxID=158383 RepID=A0A8S0PIR5_OLEEU|nr:uncharacterized protein LOC111390697 [Olea europaea var. sylvestris]CAA2939109.1 Heat shock, cysteine-rich domain containing [Olea europaea subsp. europaea]
MSSNGVSRTLRMFATAAVAFFGGTFALGFLTSSISGRLTLHKRKKYGRLCGACKGIGYYPCKLCKTNGIIEWSPLYDPVFINPCVCPTCDGFRVQRCLNCLGFGFV